MKTSELSQRPLRWFEQSMKTKLKPTRRVCSTGYPIEEQDTWFKSRTVSFVIPICSNYPRRRKQRWMVFRLWPEYGTRTLILHLYSDFQYLLKSKLWNTILYPIFLARWTWQLFAEYFFSVDVMIRRKESESEGWMEALFLLLADDHERPLDRSQSASQCQTWPLAFRFSELCSRSPPKLFAPRPQSRQPFFFFPLLWMTPSPVTPTLAQLLLLLWFL